MATTRTIKLLKRARNIIENHVYTQNNADAAACQAVYDDLTTEVERRLEALAKRKKG